MPKIAIYAGSFDPITRGHEDVIKRASQFVDKLIVAVAPNLSKQSLFTLEERFDMIGEVLNGHEGIEVHRLDGLLVDFAAKMGANLLVRGLRAVSDFEYEFQMALMNRTLSPNLETIFMVPSVETTYISSSIIREVAKYGGDVKDVVHPYVASALRLKFGHNS